MFCFLQVWAASHLYFLYLWPGIHFFLKIYWIVILMLLINTCILCLHEVLVCLCLFLICVCVCVCVCMCVFLGLSCRLRRQLHWQTTCHASMRTWVQSPMREIKTCGLDEKSSHRLIYLNTWSPVGGTVWEGLGNVALLEEVWPCWGMCVTGSALKFQKTNKCLQCPVIHTKLLLNLYSHPVEYLILGSNWYTLSYF